MTAIPVSTPRPRLPWSARIRRRLGWWLQPHVASGARDRRDVAVLLVAVFIAVAPHFWHLPWWSTALICLLWFWRAWLTITRQPPLGRIAMVPLLVTATTLVWLQHGSLIGHDAGVNLLVLLIALKLLELRARRDLNLVVFLTFFVQVTLFLYDQDLLVALLSIFTTLLLFFVLLSSNLAETDLTAGRKSALVLRIFATSVPLTLALFLLFPRMQAPLFAFGGSEMASSTGLSDSMSPGAINRLIESDAVALRAQEQRLRGALRRYVGDNVAEMVEARPSFVDVGDAKLGRVEGAGRGELRRVLHDHLGAEASVAGIGLATNSQLRQRVLE